MEPHIIEISYVSPLTLLQRFASNVGTALLHSAKYHGDHGRYSYLGIDPKSVIDDRDSNFCSTLTKIISSPVQKIPSLPPFQGGLMGYFAYELAADFEKFHLLPDDLKIPSLKLGCYDLIISFDHKLKRAWIVSTGWPHVDEAERKVQARARCNWLLKEIESKIDYHPRPIIASDVVSNFDEKAYTAAVQTIIDYIYAGDIFQANMSRRFEVKLDAKTNSYDLFTKLCEVNPAPFAAFLNWSEVCVISASPERFLSLQGNEVESKPIKGTRPRGVNEEEDHLLKEELLSCEKELSENLMIVDLIRNDLSRVCKPHSVKVPILHGLESYASVHHLVSTVVGSLQEGYNAIDLIRATFPGGSITGAPKVRAMEIISELEGVRRGVYCGAIGYIGFDGSMDLNIAIRTFSRIKDRLIFNAGGGVVSDSDPLAEYNETKVKAAGLLKVFDP